MIGFNHTITGAILAVSLPLTIAAPAAFVSHFVLDMIPHFGRHPRFVPWTAGFKRLLILDAILCTSILIGALYLFPDKWLALIICTALATLPDFLWLVEKKAGKWTKWFFEFHHKIQWGERPYGMIYELAYTVLAVGMLIQLAK